MELFVNGIVNSRSKKTVQKETMTAILGFKNDKATSITRYKMLIASGENRYRTNITHTVSPSRTSSPPCLFLPIAGLVASLIIDGIFSLIYLFDKR